MREQWEQFAEQDAFFYIATNARDEADFWRQGREQYVRFLQPVLEKYGVKAHSAVDFGCGVGRFTFPMRAYFEQVIGVDVSTMMVQKARSIALQRGEQHLTFMTNADFFGTTIRADFAYCANVFQHMESLEEIAECVTQLATHTRGYAYLHFDTRPETWWYRWYRVLPDWLLPRTHRRGIRRIRRQAVDVRMILRAAGFHIVEEQQPDSEYHFFVVRTV